MIFWTTLFPQKWATWRISCALMLLDIDFLVRFLLFSSAYLEYLSISGNSFSGTISFSLESLTSIKEVDFSSNSLTSQIPKYLGNLSFLEFLIISYDYFEGEVPIQKEFLRIKNWISISIPIHEYFIQMILNRSSQSGDSSESLMFDLISRFYHCLCLRRRPTYKLIICC